MLSFTGSLKVLLAVEPCDLRKSFNGLHGLATERLGKDSRQGALYSLTQPPPHAVEDALAGTARVYGC